MMGIGMQELLIVGAIVTLLFGGKKFAEMGKGIGEGILGLKRGLREAAKEDGAN